MKFIKKINFKKFHELSHHLSNITWLFSEQMLRMTTALILGIWVARHLGPGDYGVYSYVIGISGILISITKMGLDTILIREIIDNPIQREVYLGTAFWIRTVNTILLLIIFYVIIYVFENDENTKNLIYIASIGIIFQSFDVIESYFLSVVQAKIISICKIIQNIISSILKYYGLINDYQITFFVVIILLDIIFISIAYTIAYGQKNTINFLNKFCMEKAKNILKAVWPLLLSTVVVILYKKFDLIIIKYILDDYSVGIYSAAIKFSDALYFIPILITTSFSSTLMNSKNTNINIYNNRVKQLYQLIFIITTLLAMAIAFFSEFLIIISFGHYYSEAVILQKIHAISVIMVGIGIVTTHWHIIEKRTELIFYNNMIGAIISIVGNIILIPKFGIIGAVVVSIFAQFMAVFAMNFFWKKTRSEFIKLNKFRIKTCEK